MVSKKKTTKKKIKKSSSTQIIIDYQRIFFLFGPLLLIFLIIVFFLLVQFHALPKIQDFFSFQSWHNPFSESSSSSQNQDPTVISEYPPELPMINESQSPHEILKQLENTLNEMDNEAQIFPILEKIHEEALSDIKNGVSEDEVKEKLIFNYKLAQEMNFAYQNKLNRFHESTTSAK